MLLADSRCPSEPQWLRATRLGHQILPLAGVHPFRSLATEVRHPTSSAAAAATATLARLGLLLRVELLPSADGVLLVGLLAQTLLVEAFVLDAELVEDFLSSERRGALCWTAKRTRWSGAAP